MDRLQQREEQWAIVDLVGKDGHVRTVPVPDWVRSELDDRLYAAVIDRGRLFRRVNKVGKAWGEGITEKAVWHIVKESARSGSREVGTARSASDLCAAVSRFGRRVGTDPIPFGTRLSPNHRTLPWLQAADSISRQ